uniref:Putative DNA repair protein n=1 Tax=viral metagenome TaxID=1070528 RepID=A0A6M3M0F7_9ZZZZ
MKYQKIEYKLVRESNPNYKSKTITRASDVFNFFNDLQDSTKEKLFSVCLTCANEIACFDLVAMGSSDRSTADPKEIIKAAILTNATGIIMVHNHPSGDPKPSDADTVITNIVKEACKIFQIKLFDHVIIGNGKYFSYAEAGLI